MRHPGRKVLIEANHVRGRLEYAIETDIPPRLLGDGCCTRRQKDDGTWRMELCPEHELEVRSHGLGRLGL